ncbi:hypothetical protein QBC41DRAFT_125139 [Cercophora samala]|uniref:Uncharacterized protein n=1 Tax=Cercophora samala TaxID=330535 RepID=A0AA39ZLR8_9PEZI|nr:hypothetical protein QBC41DRAFT_125139 [Cercophora samala]
MIQTFPHSQFPLESHLEAYFGTDEGAILPWMYDFTESNTVIILSLVCQKPAANILFWLSGHFLASPMFLIASIQNYSYNLSVFPYSVAVVILFLCESFVVLIFSLALESWSIIGMSARAQMLTDCPKQGLSILFRCGRGIRGQSSPLLYSIPRPSEARWCPCCHILLTRP